MGGWPDRPPFSAAVKRELSPEERRKRDEEDLLALLLLINLADDAPDAVSEWQADAPGGREGMIDGTDGWSFDEPTQAYRTPGGAPLSGADLKKTSLAVGDNAGAELANIATTYFDDQGKPGSGPKFLADFGKRVKDLYIAQAGAGAGGVGRLTEDDVEAIVGDKEKGTGLEYAFDRLLNFKEAIEDAESQSIEKVAARAKLYAATPNALFEGVRREHHMSVSGGVFTHEINRLGAAEDHCHDTDDTEGCVETTELGWQPIGTLPLPGERTCLMNCCCNLEYGAPSREFANHGKAVKGWVTINGTHVLIGDDGRIEEGPKEMIGRKPDELRESSSPIRASPVMPTPTSERTEEVRMAKDAQLRNYLMWKGKPVIDGQPVGRANKVTASGLKAAKKAFDSKIADLVGNSRQFIRVDAERLPKVLDSGGFKTQFETGRSGGEFDAEYRINTESAVMGVPKDELGKNRAIYGYLHSTTHGFNEPGKFDPCQGYGDVTVRLKPEARSRSTVTMEDSFEGNASRDNFIAQPLDKPTYLAAGNLAKLGKQYENAQKVEDLPEYRECQIHGGVTPKDIEAVCVPRSLQTDRPAAFHTLAGKLKEHGIAMEFAS